MDWGVIKDAAIWLRGLPWTEIKSVAELVLYYLAVIATLWCLFRLKKIGDIIRDFRESRGPLWDLRTTVNDLKALEPTLRGLSTQVELVEEKVEAAGKQVAALQVESISSRTGATANELQTPQTNGNRQREAQEDANWELLREYWRRNTQRLEFVIDEIKDGRTKIAYDRLPRTNYERIINKLQGQKLISAAAANASRELNNLFNAYRPRNRLVTPEVAQSLTVLDQQLDEELVAFAKVQAAQALEDEAPQDDPPSGPPRSNPPSRPNGPKSDQPGQNMH